MTAISFTDAHGPLRRLALFRVLAGVLLLRHTLPFLENVRHRFFADYFFVPYFEWLPVPDRSTYIAILVATCIAGAFVTAGLFTRVALFVALVTGSYVFLLNQLFYSNNRVFLMLCVLVLLLSPSHRTLSIDARLARAGPVLEGPLWTQYVLRAQASLLYLASGGSKLVDPDWIGGWVLWTRMRIVLGARSPLVVALASAKALLGVTAVATELFLGIGLWLRRVRRPALWVGFWFHFLIELMFSVHVFSYLMLGSYLLVARAEERDRVLRFRAGNPFEAALAALFSSLDWLGKLSLEPSDRLECVSPDGRRTRGLLALAVAADAIPLLFPIAHPFSWIARRGTAEHETPPEPRVTTEQPHPLALLAAGAAAAAVLTRDVTGHFYGYDKGVWALLVVSVLCLASGSVKLSR